MMRRAVVGGLVAVYLCLTACAAAPFTAGAAVGGVFANDKRNLATMKDDYNIRYQAGLKLKSTPELKSCRIVETTFGQTVLLVGEAPTEAQRDLAKKVVETIPHVKYVYNKITLGSPISARAQSQDAWITAKVIAQMMGCVDLNATQIKVVTEDGTVYLMGIVTAHQAYAAGEITRRVEGVQRVVTLFQYAVVTHHAQ
ncbi:MAG: BON domain-containing protein [Gammaproteobacteria bacterium]|nr:BON domain-containing protein [Gammaproteobacteria bacterium]